MTDNAELTASFTELYGTAPEGIWAAPGRVNLIGEYTDFNGGFVMPLALPHHARAAVARRTDGQLRLHSTDVPGGVVSLRVDELTPHSGHGWAAYPAGVVWALREAATRSPARTSSSPPRCRSAPVSPPRPPRRSSPRSP